MGLLRGLTLSFAVIALTVYGLAIYSDPVGFWASLTGDVKPPRGDAVALETFVSNADADDDTDMPSLTLLPPSEDGYDAEFLAYRTELMAVVETRDLERLMEMVSADVLLSIDGHQGVQEFSAMLETPDEGETYWQKLEDILDLPSTHVSGDSYCAPYVACASLPEGAEKLEPFETAFAVKPHVVVRSAPSEDAAQIGSLSYQSVQLAASLEDPQWAEVLLPDGSTGFVAREDIRLMLGAQAQFAREGGVWQMKSFLVGS